MADKSERINIILQLTPVSAAVMENKSLLVASSTAAWIVSYR